MLTVQTVPPATMGGPGNPKEAFNLSDGEEKFIVNAKIGQRILVTRKGRIPFYNVLSDEERRLFTTKPKEVTARVHGDRLRLCSNRTGRALVMRSERMVS